MERMLNVRKLLLSCIFVSMTAALLAAGPDVVTYQGSLLNSAGQPVPAGPYNMTFVLFNAPSGGIAQYTAQKSVPVSQGFFSVELDNLNNVFQNVDALWLEISVDLDNPPDGIQGDEIYTPRQRVTAVPYSQAAMEADNAQTLGGFAPSAFATNNQQFFNTFGPNGSLNTQLGVTADPNHGFIGVFNEVSAPRVNIFVDAENKGILQTLGPNGTVINQLGSVPGTPNFGQLSIFGNTGLSRVEAFVESDNVGAIQTFGMNEGLNVFIGATLTGANRGSVEVFDGSEAKRAEMFVDTDATGAMQTFGLNGNVNTFVGSSLDGDNLGSVEVYDPNANLRGEMFTDVNGRGIIRTFGPNGTTNVVLSSLSGANNLGAIAVTNTTGVDRASMVVSSDGSGSMAVRGPNGQVGVGLFSDGDNGTIEVNNSAGNARAIVEITPDNSGGLTLRGNNNTVNVLASSVAGGPSRGAVAVFDGNGAQQAFMFVDGSNNGTIVADIKNFVAEHPNKPGTKIIYTALEGPEAAMYCRGTVRLVGGRATIVLPEHFVALANPKTTTVQLTPGSFESKGVAVGEILADRIEIGELMAGTGDYDVHYLVHAVRRGFEDRPVEMSEAEFEATHSVAKPPVERTKGRDIESIAGVGEKARTRPQAQATRARTTR